uniref:Uncharacterized protein n=1 Tax=Fagus sylvatica TaxID=28930 RepID=A0A2N9HSM0_FAGSY
MDCFLALQSSLLYLPSYPLPPFHLCSCLHHCLHLYSQRNHFQESHERGSKVLLLILYLMGFVYLSIVWQLASVVSVLEDVYGIQAMIKSKTLIKGKMGVAIGFFILLFTCFVAIAFVFEDFVVFEMVPDLGIRIGVGILCFLFLVKVILFALVVQTVVYFVCKSYHHQNIDKSALSDHLEVYLGDYVRLKKDVQLGELDHV